MRKLVVNSLLLEEAILNILMKRVDLTNKFDYLRKKDGLNTRYYRILSHINF